ncbi:hypothetical protein KPATCC21470_7643 [Kitasatospora purpeofusca]
MAQSQRIVASLSAAPPQNDGYRSHGLHRGGASYLRRAGELRTTQSLFSARLGV